MDLQREHDLCFPCLGQSEVRILHGRSVRNMAHGRVGMTVLIKRKPEALSKPSTDCGTAWADKLMTSMSPNTE